LGTTNFQSKGSVEGRYNNEEVASEIKSHVLGWNIAAFHMYLNY